MRIEPFSIIDIDCIYILAKLPKYTNIRTGVMANIGRSHEEPASSGFDSPVRKIISYLAYCHFDHLKGFFHQGTVPVCNLWYFYTQFILRVLPNTVLYSTFLLIT